MFSTTASGYDQSQQLQSQEASTTLPAQAGPRWDSGISMASFTVSVKDMQSRPSDREKAYLAFLQAIDSWGLLQDLPVQSCQVRVSLPFCGALSEAPMLVPFLAQRIAERPTGPVFLDIDACDVDDSPSKYWWPAWQAWVEHLYPGRCKLQVRRQDLAEEALPEASCQLLLGVHPLVMGVGCEIPWRTIMANVLRSCQPGARCIFATFYTCEAEKVMSICKDLGHTSEMRENPFYAGVKEEVGTHLRFIVIVNI